MIYTLNSLCTDDSGFQIFGFLGQVLNIIKILVPIIIVIMGSVDLVKAVVASKEDEIKKGYSILIKRLIVGIIIFFIPGLVGFIINLAGGTENCESAKCVFSNSSKCISQKSNVLLEDNGVIGKIISINGENYTFKSGDTINSVAKKLGVSIDEVVNSVAETNNWGCFRYPADASCSPDENIQ